MGTVFEAEQLSMGRRVALKVLPFAALAHEKSLQRFRNEVRAAAALDHPHIVSIYSVGEERGVHYYAMQLIRGQSLAELIHELRGQNSSSKSFPLRQRQGEGDSDNASTTALDAKLPSATTRIELAASNTVNDSRQAAERYRAVARLGIQAAEALQHAHDQGVLHRDIKPSNLMLDADRQLYVADFGLARIESDPALTTTGDLIGTLRYMAPEQALAKRVVIDHRADVYSLGATLYELLTLQPAFGETDRSELLKQIAFEEPRPPRKLDRHIPAELETIVLKAMAKNPEERYQTAQRLADDLRAYLENRPIKAKSPTLLNRATKWSRRHVAVVWSSVAVLLVASATLLAANVQIGKWYREARTQQQSAQAVSHFLQNMISSANPLEGKGADYTVRQLLDSFSSSLDGQFVDQPEVEATLRTTVALAYQGLALSDRAEPHFKKAISLRQTIGGKDTVQMSELLTSFARTQYEAGNPEQAFNSIEESLAILRRNSSPPEPTLKALLTLLNFLSWNGRFQEADEIANEALTLAGDLDSTELACVADLATSVSRAKFGLGDLATSEAMARKGVELQRRLYGENHPQTALGLTQLGLVLRQQDRLSEAELAQRQALAILRQHYGDEYKSNQQVLIRLARVLVSERKIDEAKSVRDEAIAGFDEAVRRGVDPNPTLVWYLATADSDDIRNGRKAVEMATKVCEAPHDGDSVGILAAAYAESGDFENAIKFAKMAVDSCKNVSRARNWYDNWNPTAIAEPWRVHY